MRITTLLRKLLGLKQTVVTGAELDADTLILDVKPSTRRPRCGSCGRKASTYDRRSGRRWRHLDLWGVRTFLRYDLRRVHCRQCSVRTELVPWAEHASYFTLPFEHQVAYLAQRTDQTTVCKVMRIAWKTVGEIVERVVERHELHDTLLDDLVHIGIDELSYRRHHEYITVVVDLARGRVVWARPGRNAETVSRFFEDLGPERRARLETVCIDMSAAYEKAVREAVPDVEVVFDRFHVQRLAHDALDEVRRSLVREAAPEDRRPLKRTRVALQKRTWNLTPKETTKLSGVARANKPLYRAYLLKDILCSILDVDDVHAAKHSLRDWLSWASRSRLPPFVKLARTIRRRFDGILAYIRTGLSNGPVEGLNGKARVITRRAFGFHSAHRLIAYLFLCCAGLHLDPRAPRLPLSDPLIL